MSAVTRTPREVLEPVFDQACQTDEFEYACTLLRVRGLQSAGWNALVESNKLLTDLSSIIESHPNDHTRTRLGLLMYCHIIEMSVPYDVVGNMLQVCLGERYSMDVCETQLKKQKKSMFPIEKISLLKEWSMLAGFPDVGALYDGFFENRIRNAFFHSDYVLHGDNLNLTSGKGIVIKGKYTCSIPIASEVVPRMNNAIQYASEFLRLLDDSIRAYKQPKTVRSRMGADGGLLDINFEVDAQRGLIGFSGYSVSPPSSGSD